ncbi:MAG: cupin domain-containing protein [Ferrimicrobium sp.]
MISASYTDVRSARAYRISAGDSVKLAVVNHPTSAHDTSVIFEVWEQGGAQPLNSHPRSHETFFFLRGRGRALSDGREVEVTAGGFLVLAPKSLHRIVNTGVGRLYAITTMSPDDGFASMIEAGVPTAFDQDDYDIFASVLDVP